MSRLARDFFAQSPVMAAPLFAMGIFFLTFVAVLIWVLRRKSVAFNRVEGLALFDGERVISRPERGGQQ